MNFTQLEFKFYELQKKEQTLPYFEKPKDENEILLNLQREYKNGNKEALNKMYELGLKIAKKYIGSKAKINKFIARLSNEEREEKAHNAITYIIERYLKKKDFVITKSFTAYLYLRILHELFYKRKVDKIVDFVDLDELRGI
ncbi:hypothetical protein [Treponema pectinovorum]|uniref:hypothetical protein n=1 Tax=Treponema pectinovorum TaxID=164 RepID=UPI0011CAC32C|nr:hypothetical protein [Treponema pectinovorum]